MLTYSTMSFSGRRQTNTPPPENPLYRVRLEDLLNFTPGLLSEMPTTATIDIRRYYQCQLAVKLVETEGSSTVAAVDRLKAEAYVSLLDAQLVSPDVEWLIAVLAARELEPEDRELIGAWHEQYVAWTALAATHGFDELADGLAAITNRMDGLNGDICLGTVTEVGLPQ